MCLLYAGADNQDTASLSRMSGSVGLDQVHCSMTFPRSHMAGHSDAFDLFLKHDGLDREFAGLAFNRNQLFLAKIRHIVKRTARVVEIAQQPVDHLVEISDGQDAMPFFGQVSARHTVDDPDPVFFTRQWEMHSEALALVVVF